jgi:hypothetical protein
VAASPASARTAVCWALAQVPPNRWEAAATIRAVSGPDVTDQPMRRPASAWLFDSPSTTTQCDGSAGTTSSTDGGAATAVGTLRYTSSASTTIRCRSAQASTSRSVSTGTTAPSGLRGELTTTTRLAGVRCRSSAATESSPATGTGTPPHIRTSGG